MNMKFNKYASNLILLKNLNFIKIISNTSLDRELLTYKNNRFFIKIRRLLRNHLINLNSYRIKRSYIKKFLTKHNFISKIMFNFLIFFTFLKSPYNEKFINNSIFIFGNCSSFLGKYTYAAICKYFNLFKILKNFPLNKYLNTHDLNSVLNLYNIFNIHFFKFLLSDIYKINLNSNFKFILC